VRFDQFKEFERHIDAEKISIHKIIRFKVNDVDRLVKLAREKYSKMYDRTDILVQHINEYEAKKDELITYTRKRYDVVDDDFFAGTIEL